MATRLTPDDRVWLARAHEQLDSFEVTARAELDRLAAPAVGNQAARRREFRKRAKVQKLPYYLRACLQHVTLTRAELVKSPRAGKAVYHALFTGVFAMYPIVADVRQSRRRQRIAAHKTNKEIANKKRKSPRA